MSQTPADGAVQPSKEPSMDPAQAEYLRSQLRSEQNLLLAIIAGAVACLVGAGAWAAITVATGHQIGYMAIGVAFLVGVAVRAMGKGVDTAFGLIGSAFSLLGCALGNLLAVTAIVAAQHGVPLLQVLPRLNLTTASRLMVAFFSPMDLLFYGLAVYVGYRVSFRRLSAGDLQQKLSGPGGAPVGGQA
jgi:hypothetical protein